jgi:hypothetical protein
LGLGDGYLGGLITNNLSLNPAAVDYYSQKVGDWVSGVFGHPRVQGGLKVVGGGTEMAIGAAAASTPTGIGQVVGGAAICHGADVCYSGLRQVISGEPQRSSTSRWIESVARAGGASPPTARAIGEGGDMVVSAALTAGSTSIVRSSAGAITPAARYAGEDLTRRQVHDIGVQYGRQQAIADDLVPANWQNPFANRGAFGQGIDDIYRAPDGSLVVVEYKGGTAGLAQQQMSRQWVEGNITKLIRAGDPMGAQLQRALNEGELSGITYSTPIKDGMVQATRVKKVSFY